LKTTSRTISARQLLPHEHPYRRALEAVAATRKQIASLAGFMLLIAALSHRTLSQLVRFEAAAMLVQLVLTVILACQITMRRRAARALIIHGYDHAVAELRREAHRLTSLRHTRRLAATLQRALGDAVRLHQIPIASRPPPSAATLAGHEPAIREVIERLSREPPCLRAVALTDRLLDGGYAAPLYTLCENRLESELARILFMLRSAHE
jgi:hypothetical protein